MCLMAVIAGLKAIGIFRWLTVQLLAGVNIGGLATPIASLASLITIKFYMGRPDSRILRFLGCFTLVNVVMLAVVLFFAWMT